MSFELLPTPPATAVEIRDWMVGYITAVIDIPAEGFPLDDRFDQYGLDSVEITIMCGLMEEQFGIAVNPSEVFDNPSVSLLSDHLAKRTLTPEGAG
jgi:acyl carrier protein